MDVDGWHPDPHGIHEERLFAHGEPTPLVRDGGIGSFDDSRGDAYPGYAAPVGGHTTHNRHRPTKPMYALAALLIGAGVVVGVLGIRQVGGGGAETTTTVNPLVHAFRHNLPPLTTVIPPQREPAPATSTTLSPLEIALAALPRTTTPPPTTPPATATTSRSVASRVTQPAKRPAPVVAPSIVPTTTLPLTTLATTVGQADLGWYMAYGSVFNTLQTDIEKLDRSLASTSEDLYVDVHPYWQELYLDANYAGSLPPIPDAGTQSSWASALNALKQGATESILGSTGDPGSAGFTPPIFNQGAALVTAGTTQLDGALSSIESQLSFTSTASRSQVRAWQQAHGAAVATLQTDIAKLNSAFTSNTSSDFSSVDPDWQQLSTDAQSAMKLAPIPDPLIQSYWTTALNDLIQGSSDCLGSVEALPPNLFDQGVASIDSGTTYLSTATAAIQTLG